MELPISKRWETQQRYYLAMLHPDLFGSWMLTLVWGGKQTRLGNQKTRSLSSYQEGIKVMSDLHELRLKRGYQLL